MNRTRIANWIHAHTHVCWFPLALWICLPGEWAWWEHRHMRCTLCKGEPYTWCNRDRSSVTVVNPQECPA